MQERSRVLLHSSTRLARQHRELLKRNSNGGTVIWTGPRESPQARLRHELRSLLFADPLR